MAESTTAPGTQEPRKNLSRRLRYEILRRDNHTCRYCGAAAPDAKLTVDHVVPVALGGSDEPGNLVTACQDCNAGKASSKPDDAVVADVQQDALRWAEAMRRAAVARTANRQAREEYVSRFVESWESYHPDYLGRQMHWLPDDWEPTIWDFFTAGLPVEEVTDAVQIAATKSGLYSRSIWRYFCGICWRKIEQIREAAQAIVTTLED